MESLATLLQRPTIQLFAILTLGHLLADFPLQTNTIARMKTKSLRGLLAHIAIYMASTWAVLGFEHRFWVLIGWLGLAHFWVDFIKVKSGSDRSVFFFVLDQFAHLCCMFVISMNAINFYSEIHLVLSPTLLYSSLLIAFSLAVMVMGWLWANNLQDEIVNRHFSLRWGRARLLELEQRTGFGLLCVIGIGAMLNR